MLSCSSVYLIRAAREQQLGRALDHQHQHVHDADQRQLVFVAVAGRDPLAIAQTDQQANGRQHGEHLPRREEITTGCMYEYLVANINRQLYPSHHSEAGQSNGCQTRIPHGSGGWGSIRIGFDCDLGDVARVICEILIAVLRACGVREECLQTTHMPQFMLS